jgi:Ni,Fe-hydrogenase I cytochrome b subunit
MDVRLVTVVWVYPNNRDERVSCVYANTPRAWCKYIWVVLSIFLVLPLRCELELCYWPAAAACCCCIPLCVVCSADYDSLEEYQQTRKLKVLGD